MACRNGASKFQPFYKVLHFPIWLQGHRLGLHESVPIVVAWPHMYAQGLGNCHTSQTSAMLPASTVSVLIPEVAKSCAKSTLRPCTVAQACSGHALLIELERWVAMKPALSSDSAHKSPGCSAKSQKWMLQ